MILISVLTTFTVVFLWFNRTDVVQKAISNFDINRHRELIVKAISAILLLLLKHMKLNHVYQVRSRLSLLLLI